MKKNNLYILFLIISAVACQKENIKVQKMKKEVKSDFSKIEVTNEEDPICKMKTSEYLQDTAFYQGEIYGFCNPNCKIEFKKNPKLYTKK